MFKKEKYKKTENPGAVYKHECLPSVKSAGVKFLDMQCLN